MTMLRFCWMGQSLPMILSRMLWQWSWQWWQWSWKSWKSWQSWQSCDMTIDNWCQSLPMILSRAINMTWNVDILILFDYYPMWGWQMTVIAMHWMPIIKSSKSISFPVTTTAPTTTGVSLAAASQVFSGLLGRQHCRLTICTLVEFGK